MLPRQLLRAVPLPFAFALTLTVASPASAAAVIDWQASGGAYVYHGDNAPQGVTIGCSGENTVPSPTQNWPAPCAAVKLFYFEMLAGADSIDLSNVTPEAFPNLEQTVAYIDDHLDDDQFIGSPGRDTVWADRFDTVAGGAGPDRIFEADEADGGDGNDVIVDSSTARGGAGDDRVVNSGADAEGGTGDDTFELDLNRGGVGADIVLVIKPTALEFSAGETFTSTVSEFEHYVLELPDAGTQTVDASAFPGDLLVRGFGGPDTLIGTSESDYLSGGAGNDLIEARDGVADTVMCGAGTDVARVDGIDLVTGCENVRYAKPHTSAITGPGKIRKGGSGSFTFASSVPGSALQCKIDTKRWKACTSPFKVAGSGLSLGSHTLRVRAGYPAGNWDATPSKKTFKVVS